MADETKNKFLAYLLGVFVTCSVSWLSWLSIQTISQDRAILVNSTTILSISESQSRTIDIIEHIRNKQQELEIEITIARFQHIERNPHAID